MAPRRPTRLLDYLNVSQSYPSELMMDFANGDLYIKSADGNSVIDVFKTLTIADAAGNSFGTFKAGKDSTVKITDATATKAGLMPASVFSDYETNLKNHPTLQASDSVLGHVKLSNIAGKAAGTAAVGTSTLAARADHVHPLQTSVSGNAGTATKLATARTITLSGAVSGSASFDGSGNITIATTAASSGSATVKTYNATIGTSWSGSAAPYTQAITVSGILAADNPVTDCVLSTTYATAIAQLEAYANIYMITTAANKITVYATEKTTTAIPIQMLCVRG